MDAGDRRPHCDHIAPKGRHEAGLPHVGSCFVLLSVAGAGCIQQSADDVHGRREEPLAAADGTADGCPFDDVPPMVEFVQPIEGFNSAVATDGALALTLRNNTWRSGTVRVTVYSDSERGHQELAAGSYDMVPGDQELAVRFGELALPTGDFSYSGALAFVARVTFSDGADQDISTGLSYHPTRDGWVVYDGPARDGIFGNGALTARAGEGRDEALARASQREVVIVAGGYVAKISDSAEHVPPDVDQEGEL